MAYAETTDVEWGGMTEPANAQFWLNKAAEEIDSKIGNYYSTPVAVSPTDPAQRPAYLLLKRINAWLAMGRAILAAAGSNEDSQLNALGKYYIDEATKALNDIVKGEVVLTGAALVNPDLNGQAGPMVANVDADSFVEDFRTTFGDPASTTLARPRWRDWFGGTPGPYANPYNW